VRDDDDGALRGNTALNVIGPCLIAQVRGDLFGAALGAFQRELLESIRRSQVRGVILDISLVDLCDAEDFRALRQTLQMAALLGVRGVLVGLRPALVQWIVESDVDLDGIETSRSVQDAIATLTPGSGR